MEAIQKVNTFFSLSMKCVGKEIAIPSNQNFMIERIVDKGEEDSYYFHIQYGFPQSGSVILGFLYSLKDHSASLKRISVSTQSADKEFLMANYNPKETIGALGININFGIDTGTEEYNSFEEIEKNPNALKMLDFAIDDLKEAKILGPCRAVDFPGSSHITYCDCVEYTEEMGNRFN